MPFLLLHQLPNEILLLIISNLNDQNHVFSLLSTCRSLYNLIHEDSFWRDLISRKYSIKYHDPLHQSWWQMYISGDASRMCSHISYYHANYNVLKMKRQLLWQTLSNTTDQLLCCSNNFQYNNYGICMDPYCQFIGCYGDDILYDDTEGQACCNPHNGHLQAHYNATGHNIILNLSPLHFMEIWCYACNHPIGFCCGLPNLEKERPLLPSEKYICREIVKVMTELPAIMAEEDNAFFSLLFQHYQAIEKRRWIEQRLLSAVFQNEYNNNTYLVEKTWFTSWIDFLIGKSNDLPTSLDNSRLFCFYNNKSNKLRTDLIIGVDYELVGGSIRNYIERVYGLANQSIIVSGDDFFGQPKYRSISHSVHLHRNFAIP